MARTKRRAAKAVLSCLWWTRANSPGIARPTLFRGLGTCKLEAPGCESLHAAAARLVLTRAEFRPLFRGRVANDFWLDRVSRLDNECLTQCLAEVLRFNAVQGEETRHAFRLDRDKEVSHRQAWILILWLHITCQDAPEELLSRLDFA